MKVKELLENKIVIHGANNSLAHLSKILENGRGSQLIRVVVSANKQNRESIIATCKKGVPALVVIKYNSKNPTSRFVEQLEEYEGRSILVDCSDVEHYIRGDVQVVLKDAIGSLKVKYKSPDSRVPAFLSRIKGLIILCNKRYLDDAILSRAIVVDIGKEDK